MLRVLRAQWSVHNNFIIICADVVLVLTFPFSYLNYTSEFQLAVKQNETLSNARKWAELEIIVFCETIQTRRDKYCMLGVYVRLQAVGRDNNKVGELLEKRTHSRSIGARTGEKDRGKLETSSFYPWMSASQWNPLFYTINIY